ncbi:MAG: hypothetical protein ACKVP0_07200 [Pirellulaceae bacterium]
MHPLARFPRWLCSRQQSLVAGLLVLSVIAATLGVPVILEPQRDLSRPFPCMHHRCGCSSADACWGGCCCMTSAQKLAWAAEHGVTPPDYALALAEPSEQEAKQGSRSCGSCMQPHDSEVGAKTVAPSFTKEPEASSGIGIGLVLSEDFRKCNGLSSLWLSMGHALPPKVEAIVARYKLTPVTWLAATSESMESRSLSPATPPPRHS